MIRNIFITSIVTIIYLGLIKNVHSLECITCSSTTLPSCATVQGDLPSEICAEVATMCQVFVSGNGVTIRNCAQPQFCDQGYCCTDDLCNDQIFPGNRLTCHQCSGANCTIGGSELPQYPCTQYSPTDEQCFINYDPEIGIIRGCLIDYPELICTGELCDTCFGANCNSRNVTLCIECNSEQNPSCRTEINVMEMTTACNTLEDSCYTRISGETVQRGCLGDLTAAEQNECLQQGICKTCNGLNCNEKLEFQTCHTCSSLNDFNCITAINPIATEECINYLDICTSRTAVGDITVRGCAESITGIPCEPGIMCANCIENNCNTGLFPFGRPRCHQCADNLNCQTLADGNLNPPIVCPLFGVLQSCYTFVDDDLITYRGCVVTNEPDTANEMCNELGDLCVTCNEFYNPNQIATVCNNQVSIRAPELNCIQCSNSVECPWGHQIDAMLSCTENVIIPRIESCYTVHESNGIISRNCSLDNPDVCLENDVNCIRCLNNGCNNANIIRESCVQCRSSTGDQLSCADDDLIADNFIQECSPEIQEYSQRGCYVRNDNGIIVRGCLMDLLPDDREACLSEEYEQCISCDNTQNCNTMSAPGDAVTLVISNLMMFIAIFVLYNVSN